jgi:hypothetical protein
VDAVDNDGGITVEGLAKIDWVDEDAFARRKIAYALIPRLVPVIGSQGDQVLSGDVLQAVRELQHTDALLTHLREAIGAMPPSAAVLVEEGLAEYEAPAGEALGVLHLRVSARLRYGGGAFDPGLRASANRSSDSW